jgi:alpha-1,2-mannosyltransferase
VAGVFAREGRSPYDGAALAARARQLGIGQTTFPFVYPPPFALAMRLLAALPFERARAAWMLGCAAALAATLIVMWRLLHAQARGLGLDASAVWLVYAAFVAATLNSAGVQSDVRVGSVGAWLLLCFATLAWCMVRGGQPGWLAGAVLALATLVKVTPVALIIWVGWRGARRGAWVAVAILAGAMLPALAVWGPGIFVQWVRDGIVGRMSTASAWASNQSLDAVVLRLFEPRAMRELLPEIPRAPRLVATLLGAALVVATAWVLAARRRRARDPASLAPGDRDAGMVPVELGVIVLVLLLTMQITWVHTLAAIAFVWPTQMLVLWRAARDGAGGARGAMLASCAGFFLSSAHLPFLWSERFQHGPWVVVTVAHCAGMLVSWAVGVWALRTPAAGQRDN